MKLKSFKEHLTENTINESQIQELNEAKFSNNNLNKVSDLLAKIASKRLSAKFQYAWTDDFKKSSGAKGIGRRYMSPEGLQIRFNHLLSGTKNQFAVNSIDFWDHKAAGSLTEPSLTLFFNEGVNIVRIVNQTFDSIKAGRIVPVKIGDLVESEASLDEARKPKPADRHDFAAKNGIGKSWANSNKTFQQALQDKGLEAEWEEYMKMKSNDSEVTKFDNELRDAQKKLESNDPKYYADPKYVFQDMEQAAIAVAKGEWRSLIIAGMGGIGKTYGVKQVLTKYLGPYGEGPGYKWAYHEGLKTSGFGLYKLLLMNKTKLNLFDDSDSIWGDKDMINMMKIVTSDSGERALQWMSNAVAPVSLMTKEEREQYEEDYIDELMEDPNTKMKAPSKFNYEGTFINISNLPANKFDDAIKSRSIFIDVYLAERDVLRRMATIMEYQGDSEEEIITTLEALVPDAKDALKGTGRFTGEIKYITPEIARNNKTLNMRSVGITRALRKAGAKDWQRMAALYA